MITAEKKQEDKVKKAGKNLNGLTAQKDRLQKIRKLNNNLSDTNYKQTKKTKYKKGKTKNCCAGSIN